MKKKMYEKPMIYMERFELSKHIADCAWELQSGNTNSCFANPDKDKISLEFTLFQGDMLAVCTATPENVEDYCETVAGANVNVFVS